MLDDSQPAVFVYDQALARTAADALTRAEHQPALLVAVGQDTAPATPFEELLGQGDPHADPQPPADATVYDESTRLYTSGTTGMPKGVSLNSLVDVLSAHDVIMHFPLSPEDRTLNMTPWFHRGGLYSGGPNPVLYVGAESVALRAFDPATVLDWVQEHRLTFLIGAPTNLAMLTAEQSARPRDLSSLNGIVTMGAPLDREACLRYQKTLTARIFNGYGTTEAFWNTFLRPSDLPEHAGSAGPRLHRRRRRRGQDLRGPHRRSRRSRRQGRSRGRRGGGALGQGRLRLRQPARRAGPALPRRLAVHRRPGHLGRRRVRDDRRAQGRHDHLRRGERPSHAGRGGARTSSKGSATRRRRRARRALGRAGRRLRRRLRPDARRRRLRGPPQGPSDAGRLQAARAPTASCPSCR